MANTLEFLLKDLLDEANLKKIYVILSKKPSFFSRDLNEIPIFKQVIKKYIDIDPTLGDMKVRIIPGLSNAYYNMRDNSITLGIFNSTILGHELEHALGLKDSPQYAKLLTKSRQLANFTARSALPVSLGALGVLQQFPEYNEYKNPIFNTLSALHGVGSAPTLFEEGRANFKAILNSPEKLKALATLLPAYSTYIGKAGLPIGIYQLAKKVGNGDS